LDNHNTREDFLQDIINGREMPWRPKKVQTVVLAKSLFRLGLEKKASRVWCCGEELTFLILPEGRKRLKEAGFCRERLCTMCAWRKTIKVFHQVSKVMDATQARHPDLKPVFLTLTVKNCKGEDLANLLDVMYLGWKNVINHRKAKRIIKGFFRALEITYNEKENTFHPHFHAILLVDREYFKGSDYMHTSDWVRMWRQACKLDYDPICDIRAVKVHKGKYKAVAEVAKYTLKGSDYLHESEELTDYLVGILGSSMRNRRLYAFGGAMKTIAAELGMDKPDEGDLVHIDEEAIREDVAQAIEIYKWSFGILNYVRKR
jgi:plasmid rolling circle replication initiator protein Rep